MVCPIPQGDHNYKPYALSNSRVNISGILRGIFLEVREWEV